MTGTLANIALIVAFILVGSLFAAAEIALVSLRESQVRAMAGRGRRGQAVARLSSDPNRFLAAVQVGVTLAGFLSASFGGATLSGKLSPKIEQLGVGPKLSDVLALILVTLAISYVSLVLGELSPKRLALQRAESFALFLGPSVDRIAKIFRPVIWLLSASTDVVVRLAGGDPKAQREQMSDEELRELVNTHETLGAEERRIVEDVFEAGDRQIREVMVPRTEVDFIDASTLVAKAAKEVAGQPHSRYPVIRGSADDVIGFVHVRDLFGPDWAGRSQRVGELARQTLVLPWTRPILAALADMRREGIHLAIVADEYGGTAGIVTLEDLVEELIGDIKDEYDVADAETTVHRGGDVEVDGLLNLDDFEDETGVELPEGPYETVAGFLMAQLGRLPQVGDWVDHADRRITVRELEGRRVGRVLVTAVPAVGVGVVDADHPVSIERDDVTTSERDVARDVAPDVPPLPGEAAPRATTTSENPVPGRRAR